LTVEAKCLLTSPLLRWFQNRASDRVVVDNRKSKSFEEREEMYVEARNRIFQQRSVSDEPTALSLMILSLSCQCDCLFVYIFSADIVCC